MTAVITMFSKQIGSSNDQEKKKKKKTNKPRSYGRMKSEETSEQASNQS
jgi:hypothetical protein